MICHGGLLRREVLSVYMRKDNTLVKTNVRHLFHSQMLMPTKLFKWHSHVLLISTDWISIFNMLKRAWKPWERLTYNNITVRYRTWKVEQQKKFESQSLKIVQMKSQIRRIIIKPSVYEARSRNLCNFGKSWICDYSMPASRHEDIYLLCIKVLWRTSQFVVSRFPTIQRKQFLAVVEFNNWYIFYYFFHLRWIYIFLQLMWSERKISPK